MYFFVDPLWLRQYLAFSDTDSLGIRRGVCQVIPYRSCADCIHLGLRLLSTITYEYVILTLTILLKKISLLFSIYRKMNNSRLRANGATKRDRAPRLTIVSYYLVAAKRLWGRFSGP